MVLIELSICVASFLAGAICDRLMQKRKPIVSNDFTDDLVRRAVRAGMPAPPNYAFRDLPKHDASRYDHA